MAEEIRFSRGEPRRGAWVSEWVPYPAGCPTALLSLAVNENPEPGDVSLQVEGRRDGASTATIARLAMHGTGIASFAVAGVLYPRVRMRIERRIQGQAVVSHIALKPNEGHKPRPGGDPKEKLT